MHTAIETPAYLRAAGEAGLSRQELDAILDMLAANPTAGDEIRGTGGCRKVRVGGRGKGKSGGYRVITFYSGQDIPVSLIAMFSKGERADLSGVERTALAKMTKRLVETYRNKVMVLRGSQ